MLYTTAGGKHRHFIGQSKEMKREREKFPSYNICYSLVLGGAAAPSAPLVPASMVAAHS